LTVSPAGEVLTSSVTDVTPSPEVEGFSAPSLPVFSDFMVGISTAAILYLTVTYYKLLLATSLKSPIFHNLL